MHIVRALWGVALLSLAALAGCEQAPTPPNVPPTNPTYYTGWVVPIFRRNCAHCHMGTAHKGDFSLQNPAAILRGGKHGVAIVPGDADHSLLIRLVRHQGPADHPMPMPPDEKLSDRDLAILTDWVQAGAVMPASH